MMRIGAGPRRIGLGALAGALATLVALASLDAVGALGADRATRAALGTAPAVDPVVPRFVDVTATSGLAHVHDGDFQHFVGGGVAVLDCDDDGRPDLLLAGGSGPASLHRNVTVPGGPIAFERVASPATDLVDVTGAYPLDLDGDRVADLVLLRAGEDVVVRGLGDCRFERANEALGIDGGDAWTVAFSATFEDGAGSPTLAFGHYLDRDDRDRAVCTEDVLVRGLVPGPGFGPREPLAPGWCALSMLFSDWQRSGQRDLRVSNDRQYARGAEEQLWFVGPGAAPRLATAEDGWRELRLNGMGIASHDLTGDGRPEVYLTSQGDNKLQTLVEGATGPTYVDLAIRRGVTAHRPHSGGETLPSTSWHAEFGDVNADGLIDLLVTKGNVDAQLDHATRDPNELLLGRADGTFAASASAAGLLRFEASRGAALVDLDLDGLLDLVVVHRRAPTVVWRNVGTGTLDAVRAPGGHVTVRLRQPGPNVDAIGAWIELADTAAVRAGTERPSRWHEVTVGGGHAGGRLGWVHLGLGDAEAVRLRVHWPDGEVGPWHTLPTRTFHHIERGRDPEPWVPTAP
jgi:hypothetical protein